MAHIASIWFHEADRETGTMTVHVNLHPAGRVSLDVAVPKAFHDSILKMAQTAADAHEAQMQAQLLGEKHG